MFTVAESNVEDFTAPRVECGELFINLMAYITLFVKLIRYKYAQFGNTNLEMDTVRCPNYLTNL